ncbi:MAG: hypothetical protein HY329_27645 [Chloroflexi bacterium]|nr:hypothetical protein [Chloroflexota bacterium]
MTGTWKKRYRTTNGGRTWFLASSAREREELPGAYCRSEGYSPISFVTELVGYTIDESARLLVTRDGGFTFQPITSEPAGVWWIKFATEQFGWRVDDWRGKEGRLSATEDGGKTWRSVPLDARVWAFDILPTGRGWVIGSLGSRSMLLSTGDGGQTWTHVDLGGVDVRAVEFVDDQHGWVFGGGPGDYRYRRLFRTADGGRSWTQLH